MNICCILPCAIEIYVCYFDDYLPRTIKTQTRAIESLNGEFAILKSRQ